MKSTKASLTETIQYLCRGKVLASETRELASVFKGKIRPGEGKEWLNEQMYVPPLPPTNLRGCHLINVLYHVYVSVRRSERDREKEKKKREKSAVAFESAMRSRRVSRPAQ